MAEWSKARDSKSRRPQKGLEGSNPSLSAIEITFAYSARHADAHEAHRTPVGVLLRYMFHKDRMWNGQRASIPYQSLL